jgi:uncharacterized protein YqeY
LDRNTPSGFSARISSADVVAGHDRHVAAGVRQQPQDVALDAVIDGDDPVFGRGLRAVALVLRPDGLVPGVIVGSGHAGHEIHAGDARPGGRFFFQRVEIERAVGRVGDDGVGHALVADERGQGPGVDARQADDATRLQPRVEMPRRAIVGRLGHLGGDDDAARPVGLVHVDRLDVLLVRADIADMREGEGDDLPGIGRIGEDFLIARHRRVEADLADGVSRRAEAEALQHGSVRQHQQRRRLANLPRGGFGLILCHGRSTPLAIPAWPRALRCRGARREKPRIFRGPNLARKLEEGGGSVNPAGPSGENMRARFTEELKTAMKAGDKARVGAIRLIAAALKDRDIEARGQGKEVSNDDILALLQKMIKSRQESVEIYDKAGRAELAQQERDEIAVIQSYLPTQMSDADVAAAIDAAIAETGAASIKDMGKVVGALKAKFTGRMDFARASAAVKAKLG